VRITERKQVLDYYKKEEVAQGYIKKRFTEPLNFIEHNRQVDLINKIIANYNCNKILEFAPGPARLTAELNLENIKEGISIESSSSMLKIAENRMKSNPNYQKWSFVNDDVFKYKNKNNQKYDLIFTIRFLLHFKAKERKKIYQQASNLLNDEGLLAFEVMNKNVVLPLRKILGKKRYFVYDKLYTKKEFKEEMENNGFRVIKMFPILKQFWMQALFSRPLKVIKMNNVARKIIFFLEKFRSNEPYEWIVLCQKK
jgi:hypothetical protein